MKLNHNLKYVCIEKNKINTKIITATLKLKKKK